jgi:hypothetical protein
VEADYYPKELQHEAKLNKIRNASALTSPLTVKLDKSNLVLQFPVDFHGKILTGQIDIYRPSDENLDVLLPVSVDTSLIQLVPLNKLAKGRYVVKVDWASEGKKFFLEQDIFIP